MFRRIRRFGIVPIVSVTIIVLVAIIGGAIFLLGGDEEESATTALPTSVQTAIPAVVAANAAPVATVAASVPVAPTAPIPAATQPVATVRPAVQAKQLQPTPTLPNTPIPTSTPAPLLEEEFRAQYYDNVNLQGTPILTHTEQVINHNWGYGSPSNVLEPDRFSVRWTGKFLFKEGIQVFTCRSDDGCRVWIDDELVIDAWRNQKVASKKGQILLDEGLHVVRVEYYESTGLAVVQVSWEPVTTLLSIATPTDGGVVPSPTATPTVQQGTSVPIVVPNPGIGVEPAIEIRIFANSACSEPQLPGERCSLPAVRVASNADKTQIPIVKLEGCISLDVEFGNNPPKYDSKTGKFELAAEDARRGEDTVFLNPRVKIPKNSKSLTCGPIKLRLKLPDSSGVYRQVFEKTLAEEITVGFPLELVAGELKTCGSMRVGQECELFLAEIINHVPVAWCGTLDAVHSLAGTGIVFDFFQEVDGGDREFLGKVCVNRRDTVEVAVILGITGFIGEIDPDNPKVIDIGQVELDLFKL